MIGYDSKSIPFMGVYKQRSDVHYMYLNFRIDFYFEAIKTLKTPKNGTVRSRAFQGRRLPAFSRQKKAGWFEKSPAFLAGLHLTNRTYICFIKRCFKRKKETRGGGILLESERGFLFLDEKDSNIMFHEIELLFSKKIRFIVWLLWH